jgi:conjugal transfer pilus assembly protein TraB
MNLKEKLTKNLSLNDVARIAQYKKATYVLIGIFVLVFAGWISMHKKHPPESAALPEAKMDGATTGKQFTADLAQKALEEQQKEIKELSDKLDAVGQELKDAQGSLDEKLAEPSELNTIVNELQVKIADLEGNLSRAPKINAQGGMGQMYAETTAAPISTVNFTYQEGVANLKKTARNYVPAGSFVRAVLLSGADTNAGVHGQADTSPVTMRILDNGTLPNGGKSSLKGCFLVAAAYGDASSERGQIRLQRLSCIRKGQQILDVPVEGTINDRGGSDGIRGHVVMRNNKLIWNAGLSGMFSGIGSAMKQSLTTQTTSPLGVNAQTILPSNTWKYGAVGGLDNAFTKLADYYIKLAEMYHPIVQVHAGSEVTVVFLKGFSLGEGITEEKASVKPNSQEPLPENLTQTLKNAEVGDEVSVTN